MNSVQLQTFTATQPTSVAWTVTSRFTFYRDNEYIGKNNKTSKCTDKKKHYDVCCFNDISVSICCSLCVNITFWHWEWGDICYTNWHILPVQWLLKKIVCIHLYPSLLPLLIHRSAHLFFTPGLIPTCFTNPTPVVSLLPPGLPSRTIAWNVSSGLYSAFVFIFPYFLFLVPCARLSWPSRQLLSAR